MAVAPGLERRIVPLAKRCHVAAQRASSSLLHRRLQTYVTDLWGLFPSFCVSARDTASTLPQFSNSLLGAMNDKTYPSLSIRICEGFILLIRSNQLAQGGGPFDSLSDSEQSDDDTVASSADLAANDEEELVGLRLRSDWQLPFLEILKSTRAPRIDAAQAGANSAVLQNGSESLLLVLLSLYEQWHGDYSSEVPKYSGIGQGGDIGNVQVIRCAIETVFSIAPAELVSKMLNQVLTKLLTAFTNEQGALAEQSLGQSIILTGLLSTVIPFARDEEVAIIMRCIRPHLGDDKAPILQKRVYFCLLCVCKYHADFLISHFLSDLSSLFVETILSLNVVSKKYRLRCLDCLAGHLNPQNPDHIQFLLTTLSEVVMSMKDPSKKVRAVSRSVLLAYAEFMENSGIPFSMPDQSQATASLASFVGILVSFLAAESPHMQAAALLSIASVLSHYPRGDLREIQVNVLHICYAMIGDSRETAKACLKFLKTCAKSLSDSDLATELPAIIQCVLTDLGKNKNRFRNRVCGGESV